MEHMTDTFWYDGLPFIIEWEYIKGYPGNREEPPEAPSADIYSIKLGSHEVFSVLSQDIIEYLAAQLVQQFQENKLNVLSERY